MAKSELTPHGELLCRVGDLEATGARSVERGTNPFELVVVGNGEDIRAFVNSCPHKGTPLEMFPDKFLDETGKQLVCTTHGARFNVSDGVCTFGPCIGKILQKVKIERRKEKIYLASTSEVD